MRVIYLHGGCKKSTTPSSVAKVVSVPFWQSEKSVRNVQGHGIKKRKKEAEKTATEARRLKTPIPSPISFATLHFM